MNLLTFRYLLLALILPFVSEAQQTLEIWEIQGDGLVSPYVGDVVISERNIVTAVGSREFYMQTPPERSDQLSATSDGIMVFTDAPPQVQVGDLVTVEGTIIEFEGLTEFEDDGLSITIESSGVVLPDPIQLGPNFPESTPKLIPDLETVEGMLVEFENATVCGPADNGGLAYITFATERPMREAGIRFPGQSGLPVWDGNPEVIGFNPDKAGGPDNRFLSTGMVVSGRGVIRYDRRIHQIAGISYQVTGSPSGSDVRSRETNEITVGSLNCLRLLNNEQGFFNHRQKLANYIVDQMKSPDILAVQEVDDLPVLESLANLIQQQDPGADYTAYLFNNASDINNGYLVKSTIIVDDVRQIGAGQELSTGGTLHDRPPLLLEGRVNTIPPTPIAVLNLHLRSLNGIEDSNGDFVRLKRFEQSTSVAQIVQALRAQGKKLVVLGDFNAISFSDGYVDVMAQITGLPSLGAEFEVEDIVNPPLDHLSMTLPPEEERYSFVFMGNAQMLDHIVATDLGDLEVKDLQFARGNADNGTGYDQDLDEPYYNSDHDGVVLFLETEDPLIVQAEDPEVLSAQLRFPNPMRSGQVFELEITQPGIFSTRLINSEGRVVAEKELGHLSIGATTFSFSGIYADGLYWVEISNGRQLKREAVVYTTGK